jgi:hypothetical protein
MDGIGPEVARFPWFLEPPVDLSHSATRIDYVTFANLIKRYDTDGFF